MKISISGNTNSCYQKTVLVVSEGKARQLIKNSTLLASLNYVDISASEDKIVSWIQQHQPDLIVLELDWSQVANLQLVSALRLDWLTRLIPIIAIVGKTAQKLRSAEQLDCDRLVEPYSLLELEKSICQLLSLPACSSLNDVAS